MTKPAIGEAEKIIEELMQLHPKGFDLSLDRISRLLEKLGNPQNRMPPVIHVAGTNGKGSVTAFCRALLEAAGLSVHVHTSPHLVNWHERYRIGIAGEKGRYVKDDVFADALRRIEAANAGQTITVFEILTAAMFVLFAEQPADAAVVEVGLGGRFDATNVINNPAVSVIMPISLDHQAYLGDRVELIAAEKAGIMKKGSPVVIGHQEYDASQQEMAQATLCELGIEDLADRRYETLSTGQQRRLLLGRALINQPDSLLLDEPTSGLDLAATFSYLKTLRRLMLHGRTVVLVTHHIHEIPPEIDRVVLLDAGRIVADGLKPSVLSSQSLSLLFGESINLIESDGWYQATPA